MGFLGILGAGRRFFWRNIVARARSGRRVRPEQRSFPVNDGGAESIDVGAESAARSIDVGAELVVKSVPGRGNPDSPTHGGPNRETLITDVPILAGRCGADRVDDSEILYAADQRGGAAPCLCHLARIKTFYQIDIDPIIVPAPPLHLTEPLVDLEYLKDKVLMSHLKESRSWEFKRLGDDEWEQRSRRYKSLLQLVGGYVIDDAVTVNVLDSALRATGFYPWVIEEGVPVIEEGSIVVEDARTLIQYAGRARVLALGDSKDVKVIMMTTAASLLQYSAAGVREEAKAFDERQAKRERYNSLVKLMWNDLTDASCNESEFEARLKLTGFLKKVRMKFDRPVLLYNDAEKLMVDYLEDPHVSIISPVLVNSNDLQENKRLILAAVACEIGYELLPPVIYS